MGGRVLRVITRLNRGGPLRQLCALAPALRHLDWDGPVFTGRTDAGEPDGSVDLARRGIEVVRVPGLGRGIHPAGDARAFRYLSREIRQRRPDVIHTHTAKAGALVRVAAARMRIPVVHTYHGHHLQRPWPRGVLARLSERTLAPLTTAAVALTERQRRDLVRTYAVLPERKVHVVGPGLDVEAFRQAAGQGESPAARWRGCDERPLFLWAGRFVPVKNPLGLVEAVARSQRAFRLLLLGAGPLRRRVRAGIARHGLARTVACPGPVENLAPWILASDLVVLSSQSEGAPLVVLEAKILGRPALVTAVGGALDLVRHGVDGLWVPPGAPDEMARGLDRFAGDAGLRRRMGMEAARDARERFGMERLARETANLYESLLAPDA